MNRIFKKNISYLLLMAFTLMVLAGGICLGTGQLDVQAANVVQNPGFESGTASWSVSAHGSVVSTDKYSGTNSLKLTGTGDWCNTFQTVTLAASTNYTLSFYAKGGAAQIVKVVNSSTWAVVKDITITANGAWTYYSTTFNSGSNTSVNFVITDNASGTSYFDDLSIDAGGGSTPTNTPTPAATATPTNTPAATATATPTPLPATPTPTPGAIQPIVKLLFNENSGTTTANTGSCSGTYPTANLTSTVPVWSTNVPANGGTASLDWATTNGSYAVDLVGSINNLKSLRSFTITGWVNCRSSSMGAGGNRIATWINNGGDGVDRVYKNDGSLQLGINQWPDTSPATSSTGKITVDANAGAANWKFFAVTYDSTLASNHVKYYFGSSSADATLDVSRTYSRSIVGTNIGPAFTVGHFNTATRSGATDRMFKGLIDGIRVFGSTADSSGALSLSQIVAAQRETSGPTPTPGPTATNTPTATPTPTPLPGTATPTPVSGTIGNTADGTSNDNTAANYYNAIRYQASSNMTVNQMRIKIAAAGTGKMKCAIYSDNAGNVGSFLMGTNERTALTAGWQTFTLTSSLALTSGSYYWLVSWRDGAYTIASTTSTGCNRWAAYTYAASWPTNLPAYQGAGDYMHSFYATGGATPTPAPTATNTPTPAPTPPPSGYKVFNKARFYPRSGYAGRMLNGRFEGSNESQTNGFTSLTTITSTPADNQWTEKTFTNNTAYRFIKYYSPNGSYGNVAEVEFYENTTRLYGTNFGSAGSQGGNDYTKALDGNTATYFDGSMVDGNYVGTDIASAASIVSAPSFSPAPGSYSSAQNVTISCGTSGATIRYTTDGSNPTSTYGTVYSGAVNISSTATLKAIAYKSGMFDSTVTSGTYTIGGGGTTGYKTYHLGNSLTDTINSWLDPIADSAGYNHTYYRSTIPGAGLGWIWGHRSSCSGEPNIDTAFVTRAPLDHLFMQVFPNPPGMENDVPAASGFYNLAKVNSPSIKPWQYMSWPNSNGLSNNYNGQSWTNPSGSVPYTAANFEQAVENTRVYNEALRTRVMSAIGGVNVNIVPGAIALKDIKAEIDAGRGQGLSFSGSIFSGDGQHLAPGGAYFIGLVHFACIYQRSPYNIVTYSGSGLTLAQANKLQQVAWDTARTYQYSGCYGM